jgi:hypothetical protein
MNRRRSLVTLSLVLAGFIWTATVGAMYQAVRRFETTPGRPATALPSWPPNSGIARAGDTWSLVMLLHPHCSCSGASVEDLETILHKAPPSLRAYVLVYRPNDSEPGWAKTGVYEAAMRLPRTRVIVDTDGREARLFGGFTSGQTFLYDDAGLLRFSGGVTSLRGHAGPNRGSTDVIEIVRSGIGRAAHPVFGCAILGSGEGVPK